MANNKPKISFASILEELKSNKVSDEREEGTRKESKYYLIVCEGKKTEPNYFNGFKKRLPPHLLKTIEATGKGNNTYKVVEQAIQLRAERARKRSTPNFDEVWAVFDRDNFSADNINSAIKLAETENIHCAFSNEAFELWYVLHFQFLNTGIHRDDYIKILHGIFKDKAGIEYKKKSKEIYELLKQHGNQAQAIKWAKELEKEHEGKSAVDSKPSTTVYKLVESLNEYVEVE
jgi:hypothetical protein